MNDSRERFEAEIQQATRSFCDFRPGLFSRYFDFDTERLWLTWQAAERQALERAAQCAERKAMDCHTLGNAEEFRELAACIRALIEQSASKEKQHG